MEIAKNRCRIVRFLLFKRPGLSLTVKSMVRIAQTLLLADCCMYSVSENCLGRVVV